MSADRTPISRGIAPLADIRDGEGRDGRPELVIRGEHPLIAMPMLPRRGTTSRPSIDIAAWLTRYTTTRMGEECTGQAVVFTEPPAGSPSADQGWR